MKRIKRLIIICCLLVITFISFNVKVNAKGELNNDPFSSYTVGPDYELIESPLAYEGVFVVNLGFKDVQDIYIDEEDNVFICDKGLKTIFKYNAKTQSYTKIGEDTLKGPTGVTTDVEGNIYVTDYDMPSIVKFNKNGEVIRVYERPIEALFGEDSQFKPNKIAVDKRQNMYITSNGNANGIIQLNKDGEFMGYFGPNNVKLTLSLFLKRLMLSKEDKEKFASLSPRVTTNIAIDNKNIVYTVIEGETGVSLKKYNVSGTNVLNKEGFYSNTYQDLTIDKDGFIYTVDKSTNGVVQVMDPEGNLLFQFGNTKTESFSMGEFVKAVGVSVDSKGNIWVLDNGGKNIQVFVKTAFAQIVIEAIKSYNNGNYDEASIYYQDILKQNASFVNSYIGLGKIAQRLQNYDQALAYFKIANYKSGYSEVFWELRDEWLNHNLIWLIAIVVVIILLRIFKVKKWLKAKGYLHFFEKLSDKANKSRFINEIKYVPKVLKKPSDVFYDVKFHLKVRTRTAILLLIMFTLINIFGDYFIRGYLFRSNTLDNMNFAFELLKWGLIIILFVIGNSLVSSLQNGEGFFRDILIGTSLAFAPIILFKLPVDVLSNFLTYNEGYIYNVLNSFLWLWSGFNLIFMIKEMHNYRVKELILNIFLTIIAVVILVLLYLVLYILAMQFFEFFIGLIKEGGARA